MASLEEIIRKQKEHLTQAQIKALAQATERYKLLNAQRRAEAQSSLLSQRRQTHRGLQNMGLASRKGKLISGLETARNDALTNAYDTYDRQLRKVEEAQTQTTAARMVNANIEAQRRAAEEAYQRQVAEQARQRSEYNEQMVDPRLSMPKPNQLPKQQVRYDPDAMVDPRMSLTGRQRVDAQRQQAEQAARRYQQQMYANGQDVDPRMQKMTAPQKAEYAKIAPAVMQYREAEQMIRENSARWDAEINKTYSPRDSVGKGNKSKAVQEKAAAESQLNRAYVAMQYTRYAHYLMMTDEQFSLAYNAQKQRADRLMKMAERDRNQAVFSDTDRGASAMQKAQALKRAEQYERDAIEMLAPWDQASALRKGTGEAPSLAGTINVSASDMTKDKQYGDMTQYVRENQENWKAVPWASKQQWNGDNWKTAMDKGWSADDYVKKNGKSGSKYDALVNEWSFINGRTALLYTQKFQSVQAVSNIGEFIGSIFGGDINRNAAYDWFRDECRMTFANQPETAGIKVEKEQMDAMLTLANLMTDEERARFNGMLKTYGAKYADEYFEYLYNDVLPQRFLQYTQGELAFDTRNPSDRLLQSIMSVPTNIVQGVTKPLQTLFSEQTDPVAARLSATKANTAQSMRGAVGQHYGKIGSFLYQTGMSMADSATVAVISGGIGNALQGLGVAANVAGKIGSVLGGSILGGSAFNSSYDEALQRGLSPDKARLTAFGNGVNEMLFESLSLDMVVSHFQKGGILKVSKNGFVNWFVNTMVQGGVEGSEEVFTDMANNLWDKKVNGIYSEELTKLREYISQGMSYSDAKRKVNAEFAEQLGMSFLGGFVSGGVMGGGASFLGMLRGQDVAKIGRNLDDAAKAEIRSFDFQDAEAKEILTGKLTDEDYGRLAMTRLEEMAQTDPVAAEKAAQALIDATARTDVKVDKRHQTLKTGTENSVSFDYDGVTDVKKMSGVQVEALRFAQTLVKSKVGGVNINVANNLYDQNGNEQNGWYDAKTNTVHVSLNGSQSVVYTISHELTHRLKSGNEEAYASMRDAMKSELESLDLTGSDLPEEYENILGDYLVKDGEQRTAWEALIEYEMDRYAKHGITLDRESAEEEVVCRACETMLERSRLISSMISKNVRSAKTIAKFLASIYDDIASLKEEAESRGYADGSPEKLFIDQYADVEKIANAWANAMKTVSQDTTKKIVKEEGRGGTAFSLKQELRDDGQSLADRSMKYRKAHKAESQHISDEMLEAANKQIHRMAQRMLPFLTLKNKKGMTYLPDEVLGKTRFGNSSYGGTSIENTTICFRTLAYIDFTNEIKKQIGRPLTVSESFLASQMLYQIAKEPQCLYCYVSLDRKAYDEQLLSYIKQRDKVVEGFNKLSLDERQAITKATRNPSKAFGVDIPLYTEFLAKRKDTPQMRTRFAQWIDIANSGSEAITAADLATDERRGLMRNGDDWQETKRTAGKVSLQDQVIDAERYAQSASWAKKMEEYRAYNGDILKIGKRTVNKLNNEYGLRFYSFSEYTPAFIVENMQQIRDAALKGLMGLAYTKKTDFARIFAGTGMNINVSTFGRWGVDADGNRVVVMDSDQGADWTEVQNLRKHENVGAVFVATDDAMTEWAIKQDWIDVVIPFHIVRTGANVADFYKWVVHNSEQNDVTAEGKNATIPAAEHGNSYEKYMSLVKERGLTPRFDMWRPENNPNVTADEYMKLVNETRRPLDATKPLQPIYDTREAARSFAAFVHDGGYYGDYYKAKGEQDIKVPISPAQDILGIGSKTYSEQEGIDRVVADIKAGNKANQVPYGRQDIDEQISRLNKARQVKQHGKKFSIKESDAQYLDLARRYESGDKSVEADLRKAVQRAAKRAGYNEVWSHGSPNASFHVFDLSRAKNAKAIFLSDAGVAAEYAGTSYKGVNTRMIGKSVTTVEEALYEFKRIEDGFHQPYRTELGWSIPRSKDLNLLKSTGLSDEELIDAANKLREKRTGGVYNLFVRAGNKLTVDANGKWWNRINSEYGKTTDDIGKWALQNGYDSVEIDNVHDGGFNDAIAQDILLVFDNRYVKSADLVTYDSDGNIIPLSERFKTDRTGEDAWKNEDIRFSMKDSVKRDLNPTQQKYYDYNQKQTDVGAKLKTLKGSTIGRSSIGVGKLIGGEYYVHKDYADEIVPEETMSKAEAILNDKYPNFDYNCIKYNPETKVIAFQEAPNFDTAREPKVGDYVTVNTKEGTAKAGHSEYIWHHKWEWVRNDYSGFDVAKSWEWSKQWLSRLTEVSDGNGIARWNAQLERFSLPTEESKTRYSLKDVVPIQPNKDSKWKRGVTNADIRSIYPTFRNTDIQSNDVEDLNPDAAARKKARIELAMTRTKAGKKGNKTQVTNTIGTYVQLLDQLKKDGFKGTILDASSGLGLGTDYGIRHGLDMEDIEPFWGGDTTQYAPIYSDYSRLDKLYDAIISSAVVNVLPADDADAMVSFIGSHLKDGGSAYITVRGKSAVRGDLMSRGAIPIGDDPQFKDSDGQQLGTDGEFYVKGNANYQRGWTIDEFESYVKDVLGDGFIVERNPSTDMVDEKGNAILNAKGQPKQKKWGDVSVKVTKRSNEDIRYSLKDKVRLSTADGTRTYTLGDVTAKMYGNDVELDGGKVRQRVQMMEAIAEVNGTARVDAASEEEAEAFRRAGAEQVTEELEGHGAKYGTWEFKYEERKFTNDSRYDIKQKQKFAKSILKQVGKSSGFTQAQRVKYGAALGRLMDYLWEMQYGKMDGKVIFEFADRLFDSILNDYTALSEADEEFRSELLANMAKTKNAKGSTVYVLEVNDKQMREIKYAYENAMAYASKLSKALGARVTVKQTENAKTLEDIFTNSTDTRIKSDTNEGDMPGELLRLAQETESRKTNPYAAESDERQALKMGMFEAAMAAAGVEKSTAQQIREAVKETRKAERTKAKTEAKKAIDSARLAERMHEGALRAKDRRISENRERALKQHAAEREAKLKQGFRETTQKANETRLKRDMRTIALKWNQRLVKLLANPTEASHVPIQLAREVAELTKTITEYLDSGTERGRINLDKVIKAYQRAFDDQATIAEAQNENPKYDPRGTSIDREMYDEYLVQMMNRMNEIVSAKSFKDLSAYEMKALLDIIRGVAHTVYDANRMIGTSERRAIWEVGDSMIHQLEDAPDVKLKGYLETSLDLRRLARIFSGSNDNAEFVKLVERLNDGAIEKERIAQVLQGIFAPVTEKYGDEIRKWYGKKAEWIDTGITQNGKKVEITKGMRVSLAMHVLNAGNMNHIANGGITIPNRDMYNKGKMTDAYANGETVQLSAEQIEEIISHMTEAEKAYVEAAKEFFHKRTGYYVNKTSLQLLGYRKATVENYFPIHTDKNFTKTDFASLQMDGSIEGQGFLKERVNASNPVYLEDITSVVNRQIRGVALYAGLAVPMRNFNAVMNSTEYFEDENGAWRPRTTVRKAMTQKMGEYGAKVVKGFLEDASEMTHVDVSPMERFAGKLATNYVKAVLLGNLKVAMKQVASYPTAAAVIPWKYLGKALLKGGRNGRMISRADVDLINQYTPLYQMRREGNANEIASIMAKRGMEQKLPWLLGWITKMDVMTVGRLWSAAEYMVADQQNLPVGSDEYYKAVAKVFNDTIQQTQPNFTPLQRNAALRSKNPVVRSLALFGTQRMQNGGILIEAAMDLKHSKGKSKAEIKAAKMKLGRAVASQIVQNILLIVASIGVDALRGRMKGWQDDDKEITAESLAKGMGDMFLSNFIGSFLGGSETYSLISGLFKKAMGETAYDTEFTVPALDAVETLINFAQSDVPDAVKYLLGDHTDEEKQKKAINFSYQLAKAFGYATGIPLENALKDVFKGIIPAIEDIIDAIKTGELNPWLHQSGKLDKKTTNANYKEWTNNGFKGSEYFYWENVLTAYGKREEKIPILLDADLPNEKKAMLLRMMDKSGATSEGTVVYKSNGDVLIDFANPTEKQQALPMPTAETEETATPTTTPTATPKPTENPLTDARQDGVKEAVANGVPEQTAFDAFLAYQNMGKNKSDDYSRNDDFRAWLFANVTSPEQRAILEYQVIGTAKKVEGSVTYRDSGVVFRDYTNESWFKLSEHNLSKDGTNKRYEAGKRLEKTGLYVDKTVAIYDALAEYTKKAEWTEYLKKQGLTDEQVNIFLWSRGWAKLG